MGEDDEEWDILSPADLEMAKTKSKLESDREFWDQALFYGIDHGANSQDVRRALEVADQLLEARRERFPID